MGTTYDAVADDALQLLPLVGGRREVELADRESNLADGVVLREPVEVVDREDQGLAHHLAVGGLGGVGKVLIEPYHKDCGIHIERTCMPCLHNACTRTPVYHTLN